MTKVPGVAVIELGKGEKLILLWQLLFGKAELQAIDTFSSMGGWRRILNICKESRNCKENSNHLSINARLKEGSISVKGRFVNCA